MRSTRNAFTLVELLVVISIIGILMALTLPAIQSVRESGRRTQCLNNIRNLGQAAQSHLSMQGFYPTGGWGWNWCPDPDRGFGRTQPGSFLYSLLPYMEETTLHQMGKGQPDNVKRTLGLERAMTGLSVFNCPTRRRPELINYTGANPLNMNKPSMAAKADYAGNGGSQAMDEHAGFTEAEAFSTKPNYRTDNEIENTFRSAKFASQYDSNGIIVMRGQLRESLIHDGTSKTYLLGERHVHYLFYQNPPKSDDNECWVNGYNNDTVRWSFHPPIYDQRDYVQGVSSQQWGSAHTTVFNMAMADGSIRGIPFEIDLNLHRVLGGRADDNTINGKQYDMSSLAE